MVFGRENGANKKIESIYRCPGNSPGFLLWQVNNKWQRKQYEVLKEIGLTHVQFVLLAGIAWLSDRGQTVTQITLSKFVKADKMMTSQVVRKLMEKNLVSRIRNPHDSRSYQLKLTDNGLSLVEISFKKVESVDRDFFDLLCEEDRRNIVKILEKLSNR